MQPSDLSYRCRACKLSRRKNYPLVALECPLGITYGCLSSWDVLHGQGKSNANMTIAIDWKKLKDYKFDKRKSFEELCFQVAYENYSHMGTFVSIDDSGGGSGVEFYLIRPNGAVWGWQAKFYPQGRFTPGRRAQVKDSLVQSL